MRKDRIGTSGSSPVDGATHTHHVILRILKILEKTSNPGGSVFGQFVAEPIRILNVLLPGIVDYIVSVAEKLLMRPS